MRVDLPEGRQRILDLESNLKSLSLKNVIQD